jgi:hypothetical protein
MRKQWLVFLLPLLIGCHSGYREAEAYLNTVTRAQSSVMNLVFTLSRQLRYHDADSVVPQLEAARAQTAAIRETVAQMPPFRGDTLLRWSTLVVIDAYNEVLNHELQEIANQVTSGALTDSTGDDRIRSIRKRIVKRLMAAEKDFARQEGLFRRSFLKGKEVADSDSTWFAPDTVNNSEF